MFKTIFLQFEGEQEAFDIFMKIGEWGQGFQEALVGFATSIFSVFGF